MRILKLAELRLIASKCGISSQGVKAALSSRIDKALHALPPPPTQPRRILSIDLGIRNLACCTLDLKPHSTVPSLTSWNLSSLESASEPAAVLQARDAFDPHSMSQMTYALVRQRLLLDRPTHILIEQQRFRTRGFKCIAEWTIRVNVLEAMLHATLCTLRAEGKWAGDYESVIPAMIGPFWSHSLKDILVKSKDVRKQQKLKKIELVRGWLEQGTPFFTLGSEEVKVISKRYQDKCNQPRRQAVKNNQAEEASVRLQKLDDMADALLQGLAWIHWDQNKRVAAEKGLKILLAP
ncbi:BgTH12-02511 [Blumeria graminis f. sp. triticale]|uniref:Bgt-1619 n=3 Tax=Blumeria graminis TaxID=34373 RepID=A0A381LEA2_BLUGR|nr:hypothetical protein BGT96224_1619 [Blumeria graminis f. sp. tritici 96224]CAD6502273.1 BgTH12-02511 [Blumeria graminis f. sp. triticale]VDB86341.1 Bgt-1619 [Blumeria graminis f. sp. tritici]